MARIVHFVREARSRARAATPASCRAISGENLRARRRSCPTQPQWGREPDRLLTLAPVSDSPPGHGCRRDRGYTPVVHDPAEGVASKMGNAASKENRTLPRVPHADKPRPDETVLKKSGADLQNGWLAGHGDLSRPRTAWSSSRRSSTRRCAPSAARSPSTTSPRSSASRSRRRMPPGGRRPRMILHTPDCAYELMVADLDGWIDSLSGSTTCGPRRATPRAHGRPARTTWTRSPSRRERTVARVAGRLG